MNIDNFSINLFLNDDKNELFLEVNNKNSNINFKYEIYGNENFYSSGIIKCKNSLIPTLKFDILDDTTYFLKVKIFNSAFSQSMFKFFNINEYCPEENLNMSIEDISKKILFESINLSNKPKNLESDQERSKDRKTKIGTGDRSERIRTYNFPQGRVTDHRINLTLHRLEEFLEGEAFDEMIESLTLQAQEESLSNLK